MDRREFLIGQLGAALLSSLPAETLAQPTPPPSPATWDAGQVRHLLPTVSDTRVLIKASFTRPLSAAPTLRIGATAARGRMTDTHGECWQFYAENLAPGSTLRAVARRRKQQAPLRALASVHVSSEEHDARAIACPLLHLRRRISTCAKT